jgi:hypothetical protein
MLPTAASAQTTTFEDLQREVVVNQRLVVTDEAGLVITGRLIEISGTSLTLQVPTTTDNPQGRLVFQRDTIRQVVRRDSLENGVWIGLAGGVATAYAAEPGLCRGHNPECSLSVVLRVLAVSVPVGVATGMLIDRAITKTVYRSGPQSSGPSLTLAPRIGPAAAGLALSLRF